MAACQWPLTPLLGHSSGKRVSGSRANFEWPLAAHGAQSRSRDGGLSQCSTKSHLRHKINFTHPHSVEFTEFVAGGVSTGRRRIHTGKHSSLNALRNTSRCLITSSAMYSTFFTLNCTGITLRIALYGVYKLGRSQEPFAAMTASA